MLTKKKMQLHKFLGYEKAVLRKNSRWYLEYKVINPEGEWQRFRESYGANSIKNLKRRERFLRDIQRDINKKLKKGFPFKTIKQQKKKKRQIEKISLRQGIDFSLKIKLANSTSEHDTYKTKAKIFLEWVVENNISDIPLRSFTKTMAAKYLDHISTNRNIGNTTFNNYLKCTKALFKVLQKSMYIKRNPFRKISRKEQSGKHRRHFSYYQRKVVLEYVRNKYPMLFLGIILQYYCFVRPIELRRLRIGDINFSDNQICMWSDITKNKKQQPITIPNIAIPLIKEVKIWDYPSHYLIFGKGIKPNENKACGISSLNEKQRKRVLIKLMEENKLKSIEGLTFYSWKDTGAYELVKQKVNIREIQKQLRHSSLEMTQRYLDSIFSINEEIKMLDNHLV